MNLAPCGKNRRRGGIRGKLSMLWLEGHRLIQGAQVIGAGISPAAYEVMMRVRCPQDLVDVGIPLMIQGKNDMAAPHEWFHMESTYYMGLSSQQPPVLDVEESPETDEKPHT